MEIFAMIFAVVMITVAVAATVLLAVFGSWWIAAGFAVFLVVAYYAFTYDSGYDRDLHKEELNAFQRALSED